MRKLKGLRCLLLQPACFLKRMRRIKLPRLLLSAPPVNPIAIANTAVPFVQGAGQASTTMGSPPFLPGFKVVAIKVSEIDDIFNCVKPGGQVDVIGVFSSEQSGEPVAVSKTFLKNVDVFCVDKDVHGKAGLVGVLLSDRQAEQLVMLKKVASLKLAVRDGEVASHADWTPIQQPLPLVTNSPPVSQPTYKTNHGFIQNEHFVSPSFRYCDELAETMAECLADSNISQESRRRILGTTMKLLVRNAELESQTQVAQLQLKHERELAALKGDLMHVQAQLSSVGEIKNWMGPLYTNQNQTQQQMNNLMTNLQLVNRTLRLLEKEKESVNRMQANQPLPAKLITPQPPSQPTYSQPDRWSQLPSHAQPPRQPDAKDDVTRTSPSRNGGTYLSSSTSRVAPPRLTDEAVRRQQLESHMRQLQAELDRTNAQLIQPAAWEQPIQKEHVNQLRPLPAQPIPLNNSKDNRR